MGVTQGPVAVDPHETRFPEAPVTMIPRKRGAHAEHKIALPISPAFVNNYRIARQEEPPAIVDFCRDKNIPFKDNEKRFYKLQTAYQQHD